MININKYIIEKLHLNKNIKVKDETTDWDARTFEKGDILFTNPNIVRSLKKPGKPGPVSWYKVLDNDGKILKLLSLGSHITKIKDKQYESVPDFRDTFETTNNPIDKEGFCIYDDKVLYRWDSKEPEKFYDKD